MSFSSNPPLVTTQLPLSIDFPTDEKGLNETLSETYKRTVTAVNTKQDGFYMLQETGNFQRYFNPDDPLKFRSGYRFVIDVVKDNGGVPIPVGGPHVLTPIPVIFLTMLTNIYATVTDSAGKMHEVPYPDLYVILPDIFITNSDPLPWTQCQIVLEYLKE